MSDIKDEAINIVRNAIRNGKIIRPEFCSKCGSIPPRFKDGKVGIQAHHEDHTKPLEIVWLCFPCHRKITPKPQGERSGVSSFSDNDIREIKLKHTQGSSYKKLGRIYKVHYTTIGRIIRGESHSHISLVATGKAEL